MDDRKLRLKQLKKDSNREKRRRTALWKTLSILLLILGVVAVAALLVLWLPEAPVVVSFWEFLGEEPVKPLLQTLELPLILVTALLWALHILTGALCCAGRKKWKKTESYLDYRTMKNTLRQEKKMR